MALDFVTSAVPIVTAAVGGITYVAYKHPEGYERLAWVLRCIAGGVFFCSAFWDIGVVTASRHLVDMIEPAKQAGAVADVAKMREFIPAALIASGGAWLYFEFLIMLPRLLSENKPK